MCSFGLGGWLVLHDSGTETMEFLFGNCFFGNCIFLLVDVDRPQSSTSFDWLTIKLRKMLTSALEALFKKLKEVI